MPISTPAQQPLALEPGLHHKALRSQIANFLKKPRNASQPNLATSHQDQRIGVAIAYIRLKLNSGKVALPACMTAFTINLKVFNGVLLAWRLKKLGYVFTD
jgi:hypothetical protein